MALRGGVVLLASSTPAREARDEGEDRRIRRAGLFAHQKRLVPDKRSQGIEVGNREVILLVCGMPSKALKIQNFCDLTANQALYYGRNGIATL